MAITIDSPLNERYEHLLQVISNKCFLKMEGLGLEVPFFICPFKPHDYYNMIKVFAQLIKQLENKGIHVLSIDLYDLSIEILNKKGKWQEILDKETALSKKQLLEILQNLLNPKQYLVPAIVEKMRESDFDVMFIKGIGEVFPYIRSHTVLENLQSAVKDKPVVMFFPGEYIQTENGSTSLVLFGKLPNRYYRAFNIYHYHI